MFNTRINRARIAAAVFVPAIILATPALASAAGGPSNPTAPAVAAGQDYRSVQTTTDGSGVHTASVSSTMGPDGKINYRRHDEVVNAKGRTEQSTDSGSMNSAGNPAVDGQDYRNSKTTTDGNGVHSDTVSSTMGPDGKVNYRSHSETVNANGRSETTTDSGSMNSDQGNLAPAAKPAANAVGQSIGSSPTSPLLVINTPGNAPAGM